MDWEAIDSRKGLRIWKALSWWTIGLFVATIVAAAVGSYLFVDSPEQYGVSFLAIVGAMAVGTGSLWLAGVIGIIFLYLSGWITRRLRQRW